MTVLFNLADRVLNRPLLLEPAKAAMVADVLAGRIGLDTGPQLAAEPEASRFAGKAQSRAGRPSLLPVHEGVAVVSVVGSLVNRGAWVGASSGLVSYEGIAAQLAEARERDDVNAVILDVDSGGGEASGVVVLGAQIRKLRARKRVVAVVNDMAASAAYWIAAQATEIVVSETGAVGSIGALVLHLDRSGAMAQAGVVPTLVHAGARKIDGHPFAALPDDVRADVQAQLDDLLSIFAREVAAGRGEKLSAAAALATEARVLHGREAVRAGLADRIASFSTVLAQLKREGRTTSSKGARTSTSAAPAGMSARAIEAREIAQARVRARLDPAGSAASLREACARVAPPARPAHITTPAAQQAAADEAKARAAAEAQARQHRVIARLNEGRKI